MLSQSVAFGAADDLEEVLGEILDLLPFVVGERQKILRLQIGIPPMIDVGEEGTVTRRLGIGTIRIAPRHKLEHEAREETAIQIAHVGVEARIAIADRILEARRIRIAHNPVRRTRGQVPREYLAVVEFHRPSPGLPNRSRYSFMRRAI